jgi:hypothetical protein
MKTQTNGANNASKDVKQSAVEWLIKQVNSKEWQDLYIWHKEEIFDKAKRMEGQENKRYQVLSPDGFIIERDVEAYPSKEKAIAALDKWAERYQTQGYYSSNNGRIPLDELKNNCQIIII